MIEQRFIKAATRADFESKLNSGQVSPNSIAFILGSKEIWTQGQYFPCNYTQSEIDQMLSSKYVKPLTGIPATDLSSDVQISLSKADNAVQIIVEDANSHDYIEIGGLKWATTNVGANSETALGYKIAWGETQGYASGTHTFNWANYKFTIPNTNPIQFSRYNSYNQGDSIILQPIDDIVRVTMGGTWRMPTRDEMIAFAGKCNYEWIANYKNSGVAGLLFTDKEDSSKSIFFPANAPNNGCYYWTSTLRSTINQAMRWECWNNSNPNFNIYSERYNGLTVRGILATETFEGITEQQKKFYNNNKQDNIPDLDTIRSGAALGATAVQTETDPTVPAWAKESTKPTYTASEVGLGNVTNDAQVKRTEMGVADGVATLDSGGKVPSSQLPSYVDDVLEYDSKSVFPATGEGGKIYIDTSNNTSWRWTGSTYVQTKGDLVIGTTTGSAADGGVVNSHINNTTVHITANERSTWNAKQDAISDLATIRTNASTGAGLKSKVDGIEAGAQVNVIETVKVNGTALTPSSKAVNITVPTALSSLSDDSAHRTVTDTEKNTWNNKLDNTIIDANGHDYVDLGLPSGTMWATMNVGATAITDTGLYFQWGDTQGYTAAQVGSGEGKKYFGWADYKYGNGTSSPDATGMTKYNSSDGKTVLEASDDAAVANMGGSWRMPTYAEFTELLNNTNTQWTTIDGVSGYKFTHKNDSSKYVFFPAAGYCSLGSVYDVGSYGNYWSSSLNASLVVSGRYLGFDSGDCDMYYADRYSGFSVRGVLDSTPAKAVTDSQIAKWDEAAEKMISITWSALKTKRDNSQLIPGQHYRITDYTCTTSQADTQSAGHVFDIIVRADAVNVLNENATAALHEGDTYFANSKIEAWKLKYCIDNDITRFAWADTTNGKGVIYRMIDEFNNDCPYDFKNVQFKRYMTTDSVSGRDGLGGKYMLAATNNCPLGLSVEDTEDFIWAYTFSSDNSGSEQTDYSLAAEHKVHDNMMKPYEGRLPNNVMFGKYNYNNSFRFNCQYNSWGNNCTNNSWGNGCQYNSWGNGCGSNSWGNGCRYNSWGNNCANNSWGNGCTITSWGNNCSSNSWGNECRYNSWGRGCTNNSWGNNCTNNSLGGGCQYNSWGNNCTNNSWGNIVMQSTLFEGVQYTQITTENVKNVQVLNGVVGTSSSKLTLTFAANKTYTQVAAMTSAGALKIYVPGDLA